MAQVFPQKINGKLRILIAPLDWGLGHATRCIPLIKALISQGVDLWLAGEGAQEKLLKTEFPSLPFLQLEGYRITYPKHRSAFLWKMLGQVKQIRKAIKKENIWLKNMIDQFQFDAVISDNRYGLYNPAINSIIITHQLSIKTGLGKWSETKLQNWNYRYLENFNECWVPDIEPYGGLAGELSHPSQFPKTSVRYIGALSRFHNKEVNVAKNKLLVLLSGPEPQRSIFEEKVLSGIANYNGTAVIVRGLPGNSTIIPSTNMIRVYNHLEAAQLEMEMATAELVIARSGYSTIMDIVTMCKKAVLVPTPGQTEQEYLASYLFSEKIASTIPQKDFTIKSALETAATFNYKTPVIENNELQDLISSFLEKNRQTYTALG